MCGSVIQILSFLRSRHTTLKQRLTMILLSLLLTSIAYMKFLVVAETLSASTTRTSSTLFVAISVIRFQQRLRALAVKRLLLLKSSISRLLVTATRIHIGMYLLIVLMSLLLRKSFGLNMIS